jgi:hypothetical protein
MKKLHMKEGEMQRRTLLIGGAAVVLFLLVAMQVFAQEPGPGTNPIYATIEYVAQEAARLDARIDGIGGGGAGPDFQVPGPEKWYYEVLTAQRRLIVWNSWTPGDTCTWNDVPIIDQTGMGWRSAVQARARATHNGQVLGYGFGTCGRLQFEELAYVPESGQTIHVDIWLFWMGTRRTASTDVQVPANRAPICEGWGWYVCEAPSTVCFHTEATDPDGDELSYEWFFGDGQTACCEPYQEHTYGEPGIYEVLWRASDGELECEYGPEVIDVGF